MRAPVTILLVAVASMVTPSCSAERSAAPRASALFADDPRPLDGARFFDHPWPSDTRLTATGRPDVRGFPNPFGLAIVRAYVAATETGYAGFSPAAPIYVRFDAPLDASSLPQSPEASLDARASVQLVDVDERSPERGLRRPIRVKLQDGDASYLPANVVSALPLAGAPLRPSTRYALVVTTDTRGKDGRPVAIGDALRRALEDAKSPYGVARAELERAGVARDRVAHLAAFTTGDPTRDLVAIARQLEDDVPVPALRDLRHDRALAFGDVYTGTFGPLPSYQHGRVPFSVSGGDLRFDASGRAELAGTFDARVALVVPRADRCPMPASGYPIVLYAHGTGGDFSSVHREASSVGERLADRCIASAGTDQIFHGTRPGAPALDAPGRASEIELLFFNVGNPYAVRTNTRQAAVDVIQEARLFRDGAPTIAADVAPDGRAVRFDRDRIAAFGHSQGGLNVPLALAVDGALRGAVLSGASSQVSITLLEKEKPEPSVAASLRLLLGLSSAERAGELDAFHPAMFLAQTVFDPSDAIHYMRFIARDPLPGQAPKSVLMTEGIAADGAGDTYAPPAAIEAGAAALGLPRLLPGTRPVAHQGVLAMADVSLPPGGLAGNLGEGRATGALAQYAPVGSSDGHFVVFDSPEARALSASFLEELMRDRRGKLLPQ